ncbi:MAG: DUF4908 domain-containing protein [Alphaproteobacteria bacterium]|nr:DUF4908 domain-containing protein [Alphaproteobacteria bacterium]
MRSLARLIIIAFVALTSAGAMVSRAYDRQLAPVAHYASEFSGIGFVLDLSSELPKVRFDRTDEILVLRWQPAAGGDRILLRDDGEIVLRLSALGGVTLFTPDNRRGIPMAPNGPAQPLMCQSPPIGTVRDIAGRIMMQLRAEIGREVLFEANWNAASGNAIARCVLFDAIRNAGTALFAVVRTGPGRAGVSNYLRRARFAPGYPGISMQGDMLIVSFSVEQGLAGRPSSFAIRKQLSQIFR